METQSVEEALHHVHDHEDTEGSANEDEETDEHEQNAARLEAGDEGTIVEDLGELRMGKGEGPKTQVGGGVRDCSKNEFDHFNDLMDHDLHEGVFGVVLVGINERVDNVRMKVECVILSLEDIILLGVRLSVVVLVGGVVTALDVFIRVLAFGRLDEVGVFLSFNLVLFLQLAVEVARLDTEHEGHADENDQHEDVHKLGLVGVGARITEKRRLSRVRGHTTAHCHIEHRVDDGRGLASVIGVVCGPLLDDHKVHEAEEAPEQSDLRKELEGEVDVSLVVSIVAALEADAERHLEDTEDESDLHLN